MAGCCFTFNNPQIERIVSSPEAMSKLAEEIDRVGGTRTLVVISSSVAKSF